MDHAAPMSSPHRFIEAIRAVAPAPGHPLDVERLPDGRTTLVFRALTGGHTGDLSVAGPRTHALFKHATDVTRAVIVQFKPGWSAPLLGVAATTLTDRIIPLADLWGRPGAELGAELLAAPSLANGTYHVIQNLLVDYADTFTISPGATLLFNPGVGL